jgi:molecular chaperone GrpE
MSNNPDQNTQVSAEVEGGLPAPTDAPPERPGEGPEPPAHLAALLKEAEDEAARLKDAWLRAKAETENVRKQAQNDLAKAHKYAIERFAQDLLTVKDALELSLATPNATTEALKDGVELTLKNLNAGSTRRESGNRPTGEKYDPTVTRRHRDRVRRAPVPSCRSSRRPSAQRPGAASGVVAGESEVFRFPKAGMSRATLARPFIGLNGSQKPI